MSEADVESLALAYYEAIDGGDYERLEGLLAPAFRHVRGDRTIEGRGAFVRFMREGRPRTDTSHEVDAVYAVESDEEVAVRGRLFHADGSVWFGFVDVFHVEDGRLARLTTYTNNRVS